jgi:secondary thiamine-phosphate synthase enzyme
MIEIFIIKTKGGTDFVNITGNIEKIIKKSKINEGIINVFVRHTTAGVAIIENEEGILKDFRLAYEKFAPINNHYNHNELQDDDNGSSHVRASLLGSSVCIPFSNEKMLLGVWQQVFLVDFDNDSREREIVVCITEGC